MENQVRVRSAPDFIVPLDPTHSTYMAMAGGASPPLQMAMASLAWISGAFGFCLPPLALEHIYDVSASGPVEAVQGHFHT
jgi:hypothetical protein